MTQMTMSRSCRVCTQLASIYSGVTVLRRVSRVELDCCHLHVAYPTSGDFYYLDMTVLVLCLSNPKYWTHCPSHPRKIAKRRHPTLENAQLLMFSNSQV
jgi:hypothetical protein